jgi:hypothetical protein
VAFFRASKPCGVADRGEFSVMRLGLVARRMVDMPTL